MILTDRDRARLVGVHPALVAVIEKAALKTFNKWLVAETLRTPERQRQLKAEGKTLTLNSSHIPAKCKWNGGDHVFGHAVDLFMFDAKGKGLPFDEYHKLAVEVLQAASHLRTPIKWGGLFVDSQGRRFKDGLHFELESSAFPRG